MTILKAEKRDMTVKAKKLRREGMVTAVLFGRDMKESIPICIQKLEADRFLKSNKKGSRVTLQLGDKKVNALVKDVDYNAMLKQFISVDFQMLVAGEKVNATTQIVLLNEDKVKGYLHQELEEISYKAEPSDLVEKIEIDCAKIPDYSTIRVQDLELAKNKKVDILTPLDKIVISVSEHLSSGDIIDEEEEETAEA